MFSVRLSMTCAFTPQMKSCLECTTPRQSRLTINCAPSPISRASVWSSRTHRRTLSDNWQRIADPRNRVVGLGHGAA